MKRARDYNLLIFGPLIQEKAVGFTNNLAIIFQASASWLDEFSSGNEIIKKMIRVMPVLLYEV